MIAIRTRFDGNEIELPEELRGTPPREVVVVFGDSPSESDAGERDFWVKVQEASFAAVWENDEDAIYDQL